MRYQILALTACLGVAVAQAPAAIVTDNKPADTYVSTLTVGSGPVLGQIQAQSAAEGVTIYLSLNGFDLLDSTEYCKLSSKKLKKTFSDILAAFHIHAAQIPEGGNCAAAAAHFDDRGITDDFVCDKANPALCQLGDLSGKYGAVALSVGEGTAVNKVIHDPYLSLTPGHPAFIGDRSFVVHRKKDKVRLKCGNFVSLGSALGIS